MNWASEAELRARIVETAAVESEGWPPGWRALLEPPPPQSARVVGARGRPRDPARARVLEVARAVEPAPTARVLAIAALVAGAGLNGAWRTLSLGAVIRAEARAAGHAVRAMRQQIKPTFLSIAEGSSVAHSR